MSILDLFKKKEDYNSGLDLSELDNLKSDLGLDNENSTFNNNQSEETDSFGNLRPKRREEEPPSFSTQSYNKPTNQINQTQEDTTSNKDIQLILSKLDTIRTELTNIHHRLDKIESKQKSW